MVSKKKNKQSKKPTKDAKDAPNRKSDKKSEKENVKSFKIEKPFVFSLVIIGLLIVSVFFIWNYFVSEDEDDDVDYRFYNGFEFTRSAMSDEVWLTNVRFGDSETRVEFRHHPLDLESIPFDNVSDQYFYLAQLAGGRAYISWSKDIYDNQSAHLSLAGYDLARYFRSFFGFEVRVSVEDSEDYVWVGCEDADIDNLVVKVRRGETRVETEPFCIVLYVDDNRDATKVASLLLYNLFGIME